MASAVGRLDARDERTGIDAERGGKPEQVRKAVAELPPLDLRDEGPVKVCFMGKALL
nr:hypothetical protein [Rhabdothermincola sediminis]